MLLALIALVVMLLGSYFLADFGRRAAGLLEKWAREPGRSSAPAGGSGH